MIRPDQFEQVAIDESVEVVSQPARSLLAEARESFDMIARAKFDRVPKQGLFDPDGGNIETSQFGPRSGVELDGARGRRG
ncbi:hypothetical protein [Agrobacterium tumefaciens]|uniref:hypothetical protein n=1 Tax=Agrobacterium tumefaciens TaxID=358 RepID=UPI00129A5F9F|nr:hypothetical protein [Agrobacterium tumefaciens]MRH97026.1 hypothetical protein [Agrobacterium tumefaciens]WCK22173.1 hypothetical protein G6M09_023090 [Agrobacterium tumefaciens]